MSRRGWLLAAWAIAEQECEDAVSRVYHSERLEKNALRFVGRLLAKPPAAAVVSAGDSAGDGASVPAETSAEIAAAEVPS
jgi:hypothetical protein